MRLLKSISRRLRNFFRKDKAERELDQEVRFHLEKQMAQHVAAGKSPEEARRGALIELGGLEQTKEAVRDQRGFPFAEGMLQDVRFGLRMLRKSPAFTGIAVAALALGIGFSSIIFSIFYNGVLRPFPYRDASRLTAISIYDTQAQPQGFRSMYHLDEVAAFRRDNRTFDDIVAYSAWDVVYSRSGFSEQEHGCVLTPNAMEFWGVPPLLGRGLTEQDSQPGASPVVLLNYNFWRRMFQQDKAVVGTIIMLHGQAHTIVGVMPPRFQLFGADFYAPIAWNHPDPSDPATPQPEDNAVPVYFFATGIMKQHISPQTADADLQVIAQHLAALHPRDYPEHFRMATRSMSAVIVGDFKQTLFLLIAAVTLLLLISSSNVVSLLLTHHSARAREIALRAAIGASRGRLIRQLLVESLLLGLAGCMAGCFLAWMGLKLALSLGPLLQVPGEADIALNLPVLLFAVTLALLTTILFGLSPTLFAVKKDLSTNLQTTGLNVNSSRIGARIRSGLVAGQVALSMLLLVFAGLMIRSFLAVTNFDTGMRTQGLVHAGVHFPAHQYESAESKRAFFDRALPAIATLPGVTYTGVAFGLPPLGGPRSEDVTIPGKPHDKHWTTAFDGVNEGYFPAVGLRLLRGRLLSAADVAGARRVAVVNSTLVKSFFVDEDPIGHQIKFNVLDEIPEAPHDAYFEIIGIVNDLKSFDPHEPVLPQAYFPYTFSGFGDRSVLVRTVTNASLLANNLRQVLADVDPNTVLVQPQTLDEILQKYVYMRPKFRLISFGTCAGIGLGLALIGLFGVMAYSVSLQTHELGVRMALGAQAGNILGLVLRKGFLLVGGGILLGLLISLFSVRILRSQLWGVSAFDAGTFVLAPLALLTVGLLACYLPARRATQLDPMAALRHE